jgi:hypothetical protein
MNESSLQLWNGFCGRYGVAQKSVSLFHTDNLGRALTHQVGNHRRVVLELSLAMRELLIRTVEQVLAGEWQGLLYMMLWKDAPSVVIPLYIGRAEKNGPNGQISANLRRIRMNTGMFARWGTSRYYHIGELSAACCPDYSSQTIKSNYRLWAGRLFDDAFPTANPILRRSTYFWAMPWGPSCRSVRPDLTPNTLASEEQSLIGIASVLFPDVLLNIQGVGQTGTRRNAK